MGPGAVPVTPPHGQHHHQQDADADREERAGEQGGEGEDAYVVTAVCEGSFGEKVGQTSKFFN